MCYGYDLDSENKMSLALAELEWESLAIVLEHRARECVKHVRPGGSAFVRGVHAGRADAYTQIADLVRQPDRCGVIKRELQNEDPIPG